MPRTARTTRRDILEYAASGAAHRIDRGRGLIQDVKILGARSRNGGTYPAAAMSSARPLYEGARVNIDHPDRSNPDQERAFGEWFGVLENVRQLADGLYGDLAYLTSHPLAAQICEAAERFPGNFGLSHNAQVTEAAHEGQVVYEAIHRVRSVDIVCKPATTRGIFESEELPMSVRKTLSMLCDEPLSNSPAGYDPLAAETYDGGDAGGADADDPSQTPNSADWDAFVAQLQHLYSGIGPLATRMRQAVELLCKTFENAGGAMDPTAGGTGEPVNEETQTDRADRGRAAAGKLESIGRNQAPVAAAGSDAIRPRSAGANGPEKVAANGKPTKASKWDDPRLAALALLSR
jgi:hypothetical protein